MSTNSTPSRRRSVGYLPRALLVVEVEHLVDSGECIQRIASRLGTSVEALSKRLSRADRGDLIARATPLSLDPSRQAVAA